MKNLMLLTSLAISTALHAQNVGIGETNPTYRLEIKAASAVNSPLLVKSSTNEELFNINAFGTRHLTYIGGSTVGPVGIANITNQQWAGFSNPLLRLSAFYDYPDGASYAGLEFGNNANPGYGYRFRSQSGTTLGLQRFSLESIVANIPSTLMAFLSNGTLGIGGNPTVGKVDINHNSLIDNPQLMLTETDADYSRLSFRNTSFPTNNWTLAGLLTGSSANDRFNFYHPIAGDIMSLKGDGKVGIGADPVEKFEIGSGNIKLDNSDKGIMLDANDKPMITRGWDAFSSGSYNGLGRWGLFMEPSRIKIGIPNVVGKGFDITAYNANSTGTNLFSVLQSGYVGIGIVPTATLDVNGPVKLEGLNLFEFGAGVAGKEVNAGKIGYNAFGQNALTFIGAGTNASNRAIYFYAEGGATFTGEITRPPTGSANLVPIAYGSIRDDGVIRTGTGNFTCNKYTTGGYAINVTGETYSHDSYIVQATALGPASRFIHVSTVITYPGAFVVFIQDTGNVPYDTDFTFMLYKP